ncbi:O-antigen ligase family protein [bacterium]|nr:O-antigen ligase family protein [bacterium]
MMDREIKYLLIGSGLGILAYLAGGWTVCLLVVGLLFVWLTYTCPEVGFSLIPFFVILDFVVKEYTSGLLGLWDEGILLLLTVAIIQKRFQEKKWFFRSTSIIYPLIAFIIIGILSAVFSPYVTLGQSIDGIRSVVQSAWLFFILINADFNRNTLRMGLWLLLLSSCVVALYGLYQYAVGVPIPPKWVDKDLEAGMKRAFSFLGSPNAFAGYSLLVTPIALGFFFQKNLSPGKKAGFLLITLCLVGGLFSTLTRAAWLAFIPAMILFGIFIKQTKWMVTLVILMIGLMALSPSVQKRFSNFFSDQYQKKSEIGGRTYRWDLAWSLVEDRPLLGRGPAGFGGAAAYRAQAFSGLYVDNYYLEILSNYGFLGFFAFLWLILEILRNIGVFARKSHPEDQPIQYGILAGIVGFLLHNVAENLWEVVPLSIIFWLIIGISKSLSEATKEA